jgi:hypothetical protein
MYALKPLSINLSGRVNGDMHSVIPLDERELILDIDLSLKDNRLSVLDGFVMYALKPLLLSINSTPKIRSWSSALLLGLIRMSNSLPRILPLPVNTQSERLVEFLKRAPLDKSIHEMLNSINLSGRVNGDMHSVIPLDERELILESNFNSNAFN